ncbi:MAG: hypothetical protein O7G88_14530, partial [bacterium]|nr:hypothetical protein [bacterium]
VVGMIYPALVYFGVRVISLRTIALLMGLALILVFVSQRQQKQKHYLRWATLLGIGLCISGAFMNHPKFMLYLPVLFSISFFIAFAYTLLYPPSMIEIFASTVIPQQSDEEIAYCRRVTIVWVVFFIFNGTMALFTACCASLGLWSLYNGLISYVIMGALFIAELCFRYWRFRQYVGLRTDFIFKKLFPPRQ